MSYDPPAQPPQGGYGVPAGAPARNNGKAIAALVLGIISIFPCCSIGLLTGGIGLFLANSARNEIGASNGTQTGAGLAKAGLIMSIIGIVLFVVYWILVIAFGRVNFYAGTN